MMCVFVNIGKNVCVFINIGVFYIPFHVYNRAAKSALSTKTTKREERNIASNNNESISSNHNIIIYTS